MKKLMFGIAALVAVAATGFAGTESYSGPATSEYKQVEQPGSFSDKEVQLDVFGAFARGNGPTHAGPIRNHAWGGGLAVNYFFTRYFGLSAEGIIVDGRENGSHGLTPKTNIESTTGSLIFRYPIEQWSVAPYVFTGGGASLDGSSWAVYHVGVGLEYRLVPNKVGVFADGRWNYYGNRYGHDTQNNFLFRTGARLIF